MPASAITPQLRKSAQVCSVCLQEFDFNSLIRSTHCDHIFHEGCIDEWCNKNLNCPMCRSDLSRLGISKARVERLFKEKEINWITNTLSHGQEEGEPSC